jgi:large subunit ribosomal protein L21
MYAIVKTGGKQYRVEQGQSLLVERLPVDEGKSLTLDPLLYVDGSKIVDQVDGLSGVKVEATVVGHERGPKLRVVKFKPKRGYKRRTGHRQELTRIEVTGIKLSAGRSRAKAAAADGEGEPAAAKPVAAKAPAKAAAPVKAPAEPDAAAKPVAPVKAPAEPDAGAKPAAPAKPKTPRARAPKKTPEEATDGT